jgi:hypothetical protein
MNSCYNLDEGKLPLLEEAICFPHYFKSEEASMLTSYMTCVGCFTPRLVEQLSLFVLTFSVPARPG